MARLIGITQRQEGCVLSWMHLADALGQVFHRSPGGHMAAQCLPRTPQGSGALACIS